MAISVPWPKAKFATAAGELSSSARGSEPAGADKLSANAVAVPGTSEHETGLSVDLNEVSDDFKYTEAYRWLSENAEDYGFVQRYPEDKQEITGSSPSRGTTGM